MDPQIEYFLTRVAQRYRSQRWAYSLSLVWGLLALAIAAGWIPIPALREGGWREGAIPAGILLAALVASWLISRWAYRDLRSVARRVEQAFPTLEQRLLTTANASTDSSPYFRRRLTQDVIRHALTHDWKQALSAFRFWGAWGVQWLVFSGLVAWISVAWTAGWNGSLAGGSASSLLHESNRWQVEPGDVDVERGSDLFVTLRYDPQRVAETRFDAHLVVDRSDARDMLAMSRALGDSIFGAAVRRVEESFTYRVEAGGRSSPTYRATVFEYPALMRCDASIEPPSYARQPEKRIEDTRRVTVPEETKLTWICTLNKRVDVAELVDEDDNATPLVPDSESAMVYRATFVMKQSNKWAVRLIDRDGRNAKIEEQLSARVLQNKPSAIQMARPADQRVSPLQELDLAAIMTDDYGLRRGGLTYSLSGQEVREVVLLDATDFSSMTLKQQVAHSLALEDLKAQSDQLLSYFFWMEDLDREGNPRRTDGDMFFAEVRPFEELFRQGDDAAGQQQGQQSQGSQTAGMAEELGELQKKILTGTWNTIRDFANPSAEERRAAINTLIESQQQARSQTDALSQSIQSEDSKTMLNQVQQSMDDAMDSLRRALDDLSTDSLRQAMQQERSAYEGLLKLRSREFEISQSQQSQASSRSQSAGQRSRQQQIEQLKLDNDQNRYETESKPESTDEAEQREMRQVMSRLDELARRQQDLNDQLRELDLALQEAKTETEKKEIEEQLKRLRDSQQELLQDTDEVLDRMNRESNQQSMQDSREQMEQAREQLQQSSQAIEQQQPSSALASGSRAQQMMEETRESLRQQSASGLQQDLRELLDQADALERRQQQLQERMPGRPMADETTPSRGQGEAQPRKNSVLRPESDPDPEDSLAKDWQAQRKALEDLLENVKETVTESESSEPVLAEELYDTYREAQRERVGERLEQTSQLLERGLDEPARALADQAGQGIRRLREQLEQSSESVLGSEQQSLNRALRELDRARESLQPPSEPSETQPSDSQRGDAAQDDVQRADPLHEGSQPDRSPSNESPSNTGRTDASSEAGTRDRSETDRSETDRSETDRSETDRSETDRSETDRGRRGGGAQRAESGRVRGPWIMEREMAPLLGEEYQEWSDAIREVEELVRDPDLKAEAARIREAAREMRIEYKRHSKTPQWPLVERLITEPMDQLRDRIAQELLRKTAEKNQIVPLDRDPVPRQFQRALDSYFERLGSESPNP
jgi:hypothetical protein